MPADTDTINLLRYFMNHLCIFHSLLHTLNLDDKRAHIQKLKEYLFENKSYPESVLSETKETAQHLFQMIEANNDLMDQFHAIFDAIADRNGTGMALDEDGFPMVNRREGRVQIAAPYSYYGAFVMQNVGNNAGNNVGNNAGNNNANNNNNNNITWISGNGSVPGSGWRPGLGGGVKSKKRTRRHSRVKRRKTMRNYLRDRLRR